MSRPAKLIFATGQASVPDDPSYPIKVHIVLSVPGFMNVAYIMQYGGSEEVVIRADTTKDAVAFLQKNGLDNHPRFIRAGVIGPVTDEGLPFYPEMTRENLTAYLNRHYPERRWHAASDLVAQASGSIWEITRKNYHSCEAMFGQGAFKTFASAVETQTQKTHA